MHVRQHGVSGHEELILQACTHNLAYDAQCEGDRAEWMMEFIDAAGLESEALARVVRDLSRGSPPRDYRDQAQTLRLALMLARRGHREARSALYSTFKPWVSSEDLVACVEIIELDGTDGLLFAAERAGQWIENDPGTETWDYPLRVYDRERGQGTAEGILRAAARRNTLIATYLQRLQEEGRIGTDDSSPDSGQSRFDRFRSYAGCDIIRDIEAIDPSENRNRMLYRRWGREASEHDLRAVAAAMFAETNEKRIALYLHVFLRRGLPELDPRLRELADCKDRDIRALAYKVLANHEDPTVRDLALDRIRKGRTTEGELLLFQENYRPGDWPAIEQELHLPEDPDELHAVTMDLLHVFQVNNLEESCSPLMLVYEHSPCALCRHSAVKALLDLGRAPAWVLEECCHDVDEDTRQMASSL